MTAPDTIGPFCGHNGRQCLRKDGECLKVGRCLGIDRLSGSDTPLCDAEIYRAPHGSLVVRASFAQDLERALHPILIRLSAIQREGGTPHQLVLGPEEIGPIAKLMEKR